MKSFIIIIMLLITSSYAESKIYFGLDYGSYAEDFENLNAESSSALTKFKAGYGLRDAYAIEFSLEAMENESKIFSNTDEDKYSLNVELIKAFDFDIYVLPYFKAGFGAGYMKLDRELQSKLNFGSFNCGIGAYIPINEYFDIELGYTYKELSYESVDTAADNIKYESSIDSFGIGFNIRY